MLLSCVYCAAEDGETLLYSTSFTEWSSQTYTSQQMMSYSGIDFTLSYVKIVPNSKPTSVSSYEGTGYLQPSNGSNLSSCYFQTSKLSYVSRVSYTQAAGTIGCGWRLESSNDGVYFYPFNENETGCTSKNTPETKEVAVYMSDVWLRWTPITTGSTTTSIYLMDINIYGANGEGGMGGTDPTGSDPQTGSQPAVSIAGSMNGWSMSESTFTPNGDGLSASISMYLAAGNYEFKIVLDNSIWRSLNGDNGDLYTFHRDWTTASNITEETASNFKLNADVEGEYKFTWTYSDNSLSIVFPEQTGMGDIQTYYLIGNSEELGAWDLANALPMDGGLITVNLPAGSYSFKVLNESKSWDTSMGYSNVGVNCSSNNIATDIDDNIFITLSDPGVVTVSANNNQVCVTGDFVNTSSEVHITVNFTPEECGGIIYRTPEYESYTRGTTIQLQATVPIGGWMFDRWSDNDAWDNPRSIYLDKDTVVTAIYSPGEYGILVNGTRLYRGTFTERLNGSYIAQFLANVRMTEGDYFQIINLFHSDNSRWSPQLEEGGLSGNFTAQEGSIRCNTTGCYDMYIKIHYGQSDDVVYIGGGSDCPEGEELDWGGGSTSDRVYSLVGTDNLFPTAWDTGDSLTEMTMFGDGMYTYTIDSVTLVPGGDYQYKVIANHAWNVEEYPSVQEDDNYTITVETPGVYMVLFSFQPGVGCSATTNYLHEIYEGGSGGDSGNTGEDVLYSTTFSDWEQQTISEGQTMMYGNITFMANNIKIVPGQKPSSVSDASIGYIQPTKTSSVYLQTGMLPFVSRVTYVQAAGTAGRGWILESSGDGENWYAFNENDPGCDAANIAETKEIYVYMENVWLRWVPTSANPGTNIYLNEITIYGTSGSTPSSDPQIVASGYCSADGSPSVTWLLTSDSILTIGGYGAMADYDAETNMAPWYEYKDAYNSVYIASGVTYVGNYAFRQCTNLRYVDMESSVTSLGSYCFDDCWYVESITCRAMTPPETAYASFAGVNYMIPIYVPEASLELYPAADGWNGFTDYRAIDGGSQSCVIASGSCGADGDNLMWVLTCDSVLTISGEGAMPSSYASNATPWYEYGQWIKHINIEEGVTKLALNAFYNAGTYANYPNVRTLSIPSTLGAPIETNFFYGCQLKTVIINSDTIVGKASYSSNSSLQTKFGAQVEEYIIGGSVRSIANFAFYNQSPDSLQSIYLPEGLEAIGNWAFGYIDHLTSVTVPSTVQTIGTDAFAGCSNLRSVELGEGLMTVNGQAFWMCDNLTQVSCYAMNPPTLNSTSFDHYDTLIVRCEAKSLYQEAEYWKKFTLIMCPDDTTGGYVEPDAPEQITFALDSSWKFVMLPTVFGMIQDDIIVDGGEIEWGIYNSEQRATGMSGWQGFVPTSGISTSHSYIIRARNGSATLTINVPEQAREKAGAAIPFAYYESAHQQNANWNFLGNPYPFSYDIMAALLAQGITSPIAVWNGIGYIMYTPGIDVKILDPFEAFFIQMPQNGVQAIQYTPEYIVADNGSVNTGDNSVVDEYGALSGYFTINSSKEKVQFSRGNLQYNAAKDMWQFAENQYEIIGEGNANISSAYDGWIDLFGWGTGNNPTKTSTSNCDYSSFVDWGINAISNGGNTENIWRTLSANEWTYITGQRTNCDSLCGRATVNGIQGFILLPDDWVSPGIPFQGSQNQGYELNQYSLEDWQKMEEAGAVFLPACGGRSGTEYSGGGLQYWSTNAGTSCYAYDIITGGASDYKLKTNEIGRQGGYGVRLVK